MGTPRSPPAAGINSPFGNGSSTVYGVRIPQLTVGSTVNASATGNGTTATATFTPHAGSFGTTGFAVGSNLAATGFSVPQYNSTWTVTAASSSSITATQSTSNCNPSCTSDTSGAGVLNDNVGFSTTSTTPITISGSSYELAVTLPAMTSVNIGYDCDLYWANSVSSTTIEFYVDDVTTAPTSGLGASITGTQNVPNAGATFVASFAGFQTVGAKAVANFTPSPQQNGDTHIHGSVEQPSGAASIFQIMASTSNGFLTIYRDSACKFWQISN